ncbi:MAG TPA: beta galactosidase jelly roll domain-containing protein, partial [Blastocatellia bacterium]|nr:beta galactosidase jelly roll domain-containing protein [Blastocatellia bacterium]
MKKFLRFSLLGIYLCALFAAAGAQSRSLDGTWQFAVDREGKLTINDLSSVKEWREIQVPLSWNVQFADLRDYRGVAWYRKTVDLQPIKADQTVLLKFGAVDYFAEVFVNGQKAGEHEGGYLPFTFDVGKLARAGANEIAVRVVDPDNDKDRWGDMNYNELPHGKQSWYVQTGGIWQSVGMETKPKLYIDGVQVSAGIDGTVRVQVYTEGPPPPPPPMNSSASRQNSYKFQVRIIDPAGKVTPLSPSGEQGAPKQFNNKLYISGGLFTGKVQSPRLWSPGQPNLYTVEVTLIDDRFTGRFGFRRFEARDGKFYLNGEPIYIISALDQDFYPEGVYTPPSYEFLLDQMRKAKQLGLNMLRTHIKVPTPDYLRAADEAGVLIWYEIPSWDDNTWTPAAAKRGEDIFLGQLARDWNHPSVVIQSIINEAWGVRGLKEEHTRKWLKDAFVKLAPEAAKAGRLTVDNSPCCGNFHLKSDIADYHNYNSIPDNRVTWDKWVADLASRPEWLWSKHGDAEPAGKEPIVLSEFGNWGLPVLPEKLPWWFERDFNGREVTRPAGIFDRFHGFKFDRLFTGFNDLARATQRHQWVSLKHEIEEIRKHASIQGYTITEFTDLNWECNGLLDMFRNKKIYADELARLQRQDVIFAQTPASNYASGARIELSTYVSRYSPAAGKEQTIQVFLDDKKVGEAKIKPAERGSVVKDETISLAAPAVTKPSSLRLKLELRETSPSGKGNLIAENYIELFIHPETKKQSASIHLAGGLTTMAEALRGAGYNIASSPDKQSVIITDKLDQQAQSLLSAGHRVIVLANDKDALPGGALKITPRNGATGYDGNWVTNFNWVNVNRAPFSALAFDKLLGFEAEQITPKFVIEGVKAENYDDVMSGIFLGWVNKNA